MHNGGSSRRMVLLAVLLAWLTRHCGGGAHISTRKTAETTPIVAIKISAGLGSGLSIQYRELYGKCKFAWMENELLKEKKVACWG